MTTTPGSSLLPCPFCGAEAEIMEDDIGAIVGCTECNTGTYNRHATRAAAIATWNRRPAAMPSAAPPPPQETVDAMQSVAAAAYQETIALRADLARVTGLRAEADKDLTYYKFLHGNQITAVQKAYEQRDAAQATAERLTKALAPFVAAVDEDPIYTFNDVSLTLGMFRAARAALAPAATTTGREGETAEDAYAEAEYRAARMALELAKPQAGDNDKGEA